LNGERLFTNKSTPPILSIYVAFDTFTVLVPAQAQDLANSTTNVVGVVTGYPPVPNETFVTQAAATTTDQSTVELPSCFKLYVPATAQAAP